MNRRTTPVRRSAAVIASTISIVVLAACAGTGGGDDSENGENGESTGGDGGPVTSITFWSNHPGGSQAVEQEIIDAYEAETGITVNLVTAGADYEEVANRFAAAQGGSDLPDVVVASDVTWFPMMLNGSITAMDDLWESQDVDADGYVESLREDYNYEDAYYALPYARSTPIFYYNREMWEAAGLPDRGPESWEEFAEWAPQLVEANGVPALLLPDGTNYLDWHFQGMVWTFGGSYSDEWEVTLTDPATIAAGEFLQENVQSGNFQVVSPDPNPEFAAGQGAALLQSTGSLGGLTETATFDLGTAFFPGPSPRTTTGGAGVAIPSGISAERQEAAMDFIAFLTDAENTAMYSQNTGYMPVRSDAVDSDDVQAYLEENPNFRTAVEQLDETASQDYARVFVPGGGMAIGAALDQITTGGQDVTEVFTALQAELEQTIEDEVGPDQ